MKKGWKHILIISGVLGCIGLAFCIAAIVLGVSMTDFRNSFPTHIPWIWNLEKEENAQEKGEGEYDRYSDIDELKMDVHSAQIKIRTDGTLKNEIRIESEENSQNIDVTQKEKTLYIESKGKGWEKFFQDTMEMTVFLPESYCLKDVQMTIGAGTLDIEKICCKELQLDVGAGRLQAEQYQAEKAKLSCGAGTIRLSGGNEPERIDADCGVGQIYMEIGGKKEAYNYDLNCSIGKISIDGEKVISGLEENKKIDYQAGKQIEAKCGAGSVELQFTEE